MAKILINEAEPVSIFIDGQEAAAVYQDGEQVWPSAEPVTDYIEFVVNSSSGTFIVPLCNQNAPYDFDVLVNGNLYGRATGTGSPATGTGYDVTGLTGSEATITLRTTQAVAGWGRAFGFRNGTAGANAAANKAKVLRIIRDSDFAHLESDTDTGVQFRVEQFYGCRNMTAIAEENMPETVTLIGSNFRERQFSGCRALVNIPNEHISSAITQINDGFRFRQYENCVKISVAVPEYLPEGVLSIGNDFRNGQYYYTSAIRTAAAEIIPSTVQTIGNNFRTWQYHTSGVRTAAVEVLPASVTSIGNFFRYAQYMNSSVRTISNEVLPDSVTSIGYNYRVEQFSFCASLIIGGYVHSARFPQVLNMDGAYLRMFALTTPLAYPDAMPNYTSGGGVVPVTNVTPTTAKSYVSNRTGIAGYDSLNANWK